MTYLCHEESITHIAVDSTIEERAKSVGGINIDDIQWQN